MATLDAFRTASGDPLKLDFANDYVPDVRLNAGDINGRTITVELTDNGTPITDTAGITVALAYNTSPGSDLGDRVTMSAVSGAATATFRAAVPRKALVKPGRILLGIEISSGGHKVCSRNFYGLVERAVFDATSPDADDKLGRIEQLILDADKATGSANTAAGKATTAAAAATLSEHRHGQGHHRHHERRLGGHGREHGGIQGERRGELGHHGRIQRQRQGHGGRHGRDRSGHGGRQGQRRRIQGHQRRRRRTRRRRSSPHLDHRIRAALRRLQGKDRRQRQRGRGLRHTGRNRRTVRDRDRTRPGRRRDPAPHPRRHRLGARHHQPINRKEPSWRTRRRS